MKIRQLETFLAIVKSGGLRTAARELGLSQAAVTKNLQGLETYCGYPLLIRQSRGGVRLTPQGESLLSHAKIIMSEVEKLDRSLKTGANEEHGVLSAAITPLLSQTVLQEALAWFKSRYPLVSLHLTEGLLSQAIPLLRSGTIDLAFVATLPHTKLSKELFNFQSFLHVQQCFAVRAGHPLLDDPTKEHLVQYEWVVAAGDLKIAQSRIEKTFFDVFDILPKRISLCDTSTCSALLLSGDGVCIMPKDLLASPLYQGLREITFPGLIVPKLELTVVRRANAPCSTVSDFFSHCLIESYKQFHRTQITGF